MTGASVRQLWQVERVKPRHGAPATAIDVVAAKRN
jgi:hypothetical protein